MFNRTKSALVQMVENFKRITFGLGISIQIIYVAYLSYALIAKNGSQIANALLLSVSIGYLIAYVILKPGNQNSKQLLKKGKRTYKIFKLTMRSFNLGVMVYGIFVTANHTDFATVALTSLFVAIFLIQVFCEILIYCIERKIRKFIENFKEDLADIKRPFLKIASIFRRKNDKNLIVDEYDFKK